MPHEQHDRPNYYAPGSISLLRDNWLQKHDIRMALQFNVQMFIEPHLIDRHQYLGA
jgi:hypothetical protein